METTKAIAKRMAKVVSWKLKKTIKQAMINLTITLSKI